MNGEPASTAHRSTHSLTAPASPAIIDDVHRLLGRVWRSQPSLVDADRTRFESAVVEVVGSVAAIRATPPERRVRTTLTVLVSCEPGRLLADVRGDGTPDYSDATTVELPEGVVYERSPGGNRWRVTCVREH